MEHGCGWPVKRGNLFRPQHILLPPERRTIQPAELIGTDISEGMMNVGREKVKKEGLSDKISFCPGGLHFTLLLPIMTFDAITVAFGIRNFEDLDKGLSEMCRVLKPGAVIPLFGQTPLQR